MANSHASAAAAAVTGSALMMTGVGLMTGVGRVGVKRIPCRTAAVPNDLRCHWCSSWPQPGPDDQVQGAC